MIRMLGGRELSQEVACTLNKFQTQFLPHPWNRFCSAGPIFFCRCSRRWIDDLATARSCPAKVHGPLGRKAKLKRA
jgi:hypothetical protein